LNNQLFLLKRYIAAAIPITTGTPIFNAISDTNSEDITPQKREVW